MEFRIAPFMMAGLNLLYLLAVNPDINLMLSLQQVASFGKILPPPFILLLLAHGAFLRHTHYSRRAKILFWSMQGINVFLLSAYIYAIQ